MKPRTNRLMIPGKGRSAAVGILNNEGAAANTLRMVAYNLGQGGRRDPAAWLRLLGTSVPDLLFVQESRDPAGSWLGALEGAGQGSCLWDAVPGRRWGTGLWSRTGRLIPLPVPQAYRGRVAAAVVEGINWPVSGNSLAVAISVHAPTAKGSSYTKEVGRILDYTVETRNRLGGLPLVLGGDFNVAVALRRPDHPLSNSPGERALLVRLREDLGLLPCWQSAHPDEEPARTLRWMRRLDSPPYHCDGLFVPSDWVGELQGCEVLEDEDWCCLSDHNPVVALFATGLVQASLRG